MCKLHWVQYVTPGWSRTHYGPAEWKRYLNVSGWSRNDETWWNNTVGCPLPFCDWYFLLFPPGYWFSFSSVELLGPANRPPCQHYFTEDAPVHTAYTHTKRHTHLNVHLVNSSLEGNNQRIYGAQRGRGFQAYAAQTKSPSINSHWLIFNIWTFAKKCFVW